MSVIIKDSGLLTILQTVSKTITEDNNDYNGKHDADESNRYTDNDNIIFQQVAD